MGLIETFFGTTLRSPRKSENIPAPQIYQLQEAPFTTQRVFWRTTADSQAPLLVHVPATPDEKISKKIGSVGQAALLNGYDYMQLEVPTAIDDRDGFEFSRWYRAIYEAISVHECSEIILVGEYYGASILPRLANDINQAHPEKVSMMFGLCAQSLKDRVKCIEGHSDFSELQEGQTGVLPISRKLYQGGNDYYSLGLYFDLKDFANNQPVCDRFKGVAIFVHDMLDEQGSKDANKQLTAAQRCAIRSTGHDLRDPRVRSGLILHGLNNLHESQKRGFIKISCG